MKKEGKKDKIAKTGILAGGILTGTGAGLVGANTLLAKKAVTNPKLRENLVKVAGEKGYRLASKMIKSNKNAGTITTAVGAPILAVSSYKHYKNKKNKKDDSAKG
jgi:hypothetical protein